jgi:hypothetical protein
MPNDSMTHTVRPNVTFLERRLEDWGFIMAGPSDQQRGAQLWREGSV